MSGQQKYNKLANKHVLVIGGTSGTSFLSDLDVSDREEGLQSSTGIGYAVAEASIESGARVTISSSSHDRVLSSIESLKNSYPKALVEGHACDLSKPTVEKDIEELFKNTGKLDHIIFTAGDKLATIPIYESTLESIQKAGQIRFFAPLLVAKVGSRYLNPGPTSSIVLTTGSVAEHPHPNWSVVASYAAGLHGMTRNLALDLKPIRVNLVSPGVIDTELWKYMPSDAKAQMFESISKRVPTGHVGKRRSLPLLDLRVLLTFDS
jgi:NAD(P)-dependent dehydrogenase (short-subunit alcohol dehydrogenase family)